MADADVDSAVAPPPPTAAAAPPPRPRSRTAVARWVALTALVPVAFAIVVLALNSGVYSAGGFVSRYLDALDRRDVAVALETPGVRIPVGTSTAALRRDALPGLGGHRIVSDVDAGDGTHRVTAEYRLGGQVKRTDFVVRPAPPAFGVFNGWRFAESPVARLRVTVLNGTDFRVNGLEVNDAAPLTTGESVVDLAVLSPARVVLDQDSRYLEAAPVAVAVTDAGGATEATVDVQASDEFRAAVQTEVDGFLDDCAKQTVLQPAGCPFRKLLDDRVLDAPSWSIASYPKIGIEPGVGDDGNFAWFVPPTSGVAHIKVGVVSLFDGSVSQLDEDVPFTVQYAIVVRDDGGLEIRSI